MDDVTCPVCGADVTAVRALAEHFVALSERSDGRHIMWLNRNVTKLRTPASDLEPLLAAVLSGERPATARVWR
jgi:hypothetical protein